VNARKELEKSTEEAIQRGAFGVPGFWIPDAVWTGVSGEERKGRFFWGQDRMHFVEATLNALSSSSSSAGKGWSSVPGLKSLMPRCVPKNTPHGRVKLEFWFDFSSPWAFLGYTQLERLKSSFGSGLEVVMKPFLLGILFREIGAPNLPGSAVSPAKAKWSRQDHADWTEYWNAVSAQDGGRQVKFHWADAFPIRTPTVLRVAIVEPETTKLLCKSQSRLFLVHLTSSMQHANQAQSKRAGRTTKTSLTIPSSAVFLTKAASVVRTSSRARTIPR